MRNRRHRSHCWKAPIPYSSGSASYTLRISRAQAALVRCAYLLAEERGRREILERNLAELKREVTPQAQSE
jgi:hypothetical protein